MLKHYIVNSLMTVDLHLFTNINECDNNPCQNGGRCTNSEGSFTCSCTDGWEGPVCDQGNLNK